MAAGSRMEHQRTRSRHIVKKSKITTIPFFITIRIWLPDMEKADTSNPLKIKSVLVAIDSSKKSVKALEFSFRLLANNREGKLYIINAVNPVLLRVSGDAPQTGIMVIEKQEEEVKLARRLVSHAVAHAKANGILNVEGIVKEADPVRAIIQTADAVKPDIIVLGNRGRGFRRGIFFGSVSQRVAADSPVSVMIVK